MLFLLEINIKEPEAKAQDVSLTQKVNKLKVVAPEATSVKKVKLKNQILFLNMRN